MSHIIDINPIELTVDDTRNFSKKHSYNKAQKPSLIEQVLHHGALQRYNFVLLFLPTKEKGNALCATVSHRLPLSPSITRDLSGFFTTLHAMLNTNNKRTIL